MPGIRVSLIILILFGGSLAGISGHRLTPETAHAADATVATCDETSFDAALDTVQTTGGGAIRFSCEGTIAFTGEKTITSNVSIVGEARVTFDGNNATRLFTINEGASLALQTVRLQSGNATSGGAIFNNGTLTVSTSTLDTNTAGAGGAIFNDLGTATIIASTFSNNTSTGAGGAINNARGSLTITDSSFTLNRNTTNAGRGGAIHNSPNLTVTLTNTNFTQNTALSFGGAIHSQGTVNVTGGLFSQNDATAGGGGAIFSEGPLTVGRGLFMGNTAGNAGGAITHRTGVAEITASTFSGNGAGGVGGALFNGATMTVTASTFAGNQSPNGVGGAINNTIESSLTIIASTIVANSAANGGGINNASNATVRGSIIANNASAATTNCSGTVTSLGSNLSNDSTCNLGAEGDIRDSVNIGLQPLAFNGGVTTTMRLNPDSAAVNAANCDNSSAQDQRGVTRPKGGGCDIGAFELQPPEVQIPVVTPSPSDEGQEVRATAAFTLPELTLPQPLGIPIDVACTVDYGDGSGPQPGTADAVNFTCTGPAHTYADDNPTGTPADPVNVTVSVSEARSGAGSSAVVHTINNIPPTITGITTSSPVSEGQLAQIQVMATDPGGPGDPLTYRFDCDNNGSYETAGAGNMGQCSIDGQTTIGVQVSDDDTGVTTQTVEVTGGPSGPLPPGPNPPPPTGPQPPGNDFFQRTWERTDKPVADVVTARTWMWEPQAFTAVIMEPYAESPGQMRQVQYFDKARMEITDPNADSNSIWYVTNGLLVVELITGQMQVGNAAFETRIPAQVNVAGDADDTNGPTYATFNGLLDAAPRAAGTVIIQRVDRAGNVADDQSLLGQNVAVGFVDDVTNHGIAAPFWAFMNSSGPVLEDGQIVNDQLFENAFFATGRPITEAYWAKVKVAGTERDVLIQCFERRCLTYTPGNPDGFVVEAGNVGQHYFNWRYGG